LPDEKAKIMCLKFAEVERKLGEVDRARAVLQHGSQFADPRREAVYWSEWHEFEVAHGNEDTYKEMLRVKRSVQTAYSQVRSITSV
jgi:pre-mRNA-splicing factor SYF1